MALPASSPLPPRLSRIGEQGIYDQRLAGIICRNLKADLTLSPKHVAACDLLSDVAALLVDHGLLESNLAAARVQNQIPTGACFQPLCANDDEPDGPRVRAPRDDEAGFELPLIAGVDEIYSAADTFVSDLRVRGDVCAPFRGLA